MASSMFMLLHSWGFAVTLVCGLKISKHADHSNHLKTTAHATLQPTNSMKMQEVFPELGDQVEFVAKGFPNAKRPRLLVMPGCSGSSWISHMSKELLLDYGINYYHGSELFKEEKWRPAVPNASSVSEAIYTLWQTAGKQGLTLELKAQGMHQLAPAVKLLKKLGAYVALGYRRNALDQVVCRVRDCFGQKKKHEHLDGIPVDESGNRSDLCFQRREFWPDSQNATNHKALLETKTLASALKERVATTEKNRMFLKKHGWKKFPVLSYEALTDFESQPEELDNAVDAWAQLLLAWGVTPDKAKIKAKLEKLAGTRPIPPHESTIYNMAEVETALEHDPELAKMIRHRQTS